VLQVLFRELTTRERSPRVPEPDLVMDKPENVDAYARASTVDQVLAPVYLHNAAHVCDVIRPGDLVLDLGCGPATQLAVIAQLNPDVRFLGVDLSAPMLETGRDHLASTGTRNVELRVGDMTDLSGIDDCSVDAAVSTLTLHHLPDAQALHATFRAIKRVLKPDGGLFLLDLGRLKSSKSMHYFANQYADRQSPLFTLDYWNSLNAAFSVEDYKSAVSVLSSAGRLYTTFLAPYMVAFKSPARRRPPETLRAAFERLRAELPAHHKRDLRDLTAFFRFGGLRSALL
jgi:ubiquinone/menaquinone biosynthesis C-methylase UbiE